MSAEIVNRSLKTLGQFSKLKLKGRSWPSYAAKDIYQSGRETAYHGPVSLAPCPSAVGKSFTG